MHFVKNRARLYAGTVLSTAAATEINWPFLLINDVSMLLTYLLTFLLNQTESRC